jgi:hypothetical protein
MTRRRSLAAATLLLTLPLASCTNSSPEAGRPDTTPSPSAPTPTPSAPTTPTWTSEELQAIDAAKHRYAAARAAVDSVLAKPSAFDRKALEKAGNGGEWIITVTGDAMKLDQFGWYRVGRTKVSDTRVTSVKLDVEQPEVLMNSCVDTSAVVTRFQKDNKPVPLGPGNGKRHRFSSKLVFAQSINGGPKMWFLVSEKGGGRC